MATLVMPNIGEGVTEGTVTRWLKHEGDAVALDDPVVEVETDKAVVEIPSPFEGTLMRIVVQEGQQVPIGEPLAEFATAGDDVLPPAHEATAPARARPPAEERAPAPTASSAPSAPPPSAQPQRATGGGDGRRGPGTWYSPAVMSLAAEHDIDLAALTGTGQGGRVTRKDVLAYVERGAPAAASAVVSAPGEERPPPVAAPTPEPPRQADAERVTLSATRRSIAQHMTTAHQTIPAAWMMVEADVTGLVALREQVKEEFLRTEGVRLTYLPFCVQAIVAALKQHRGLNASYADGAIDVHRHFHVGLAVATDSGLLTPVVRDADRKSVAGLAREIDDLGRRARERALKLEELRGATLTINNTGAFGSVVSQPIVPVGQVAIVTTEVIRRELRVMPDGSFAPRSVMNICISFDHRALDGAEAGAFMHDVVEHLQAYRPDQPVY